MNKKNACYLSRFTGRKVNFWIGGSSYMGRKLSKIDFSSELAFFIGEETKLRMIPFESIQFFEIADLTREEEQRLIQP